MPGSDARHFVDAVYRRLVFFRVVEQLGRGLFFASIIAIALLAVAIWQSMPTLPILLFCGSFGLLIGCALAVYRWPTRMTAALEADRQLQMDDLLTTALFSTMVAEGDFQQTVITMADARCCLHSPSDVFLRQFGVRSWSGIGLMMGIAVTLAVVPLRPSSSQAVDSNMSVLSADPTESTSANTLQQDRGPITRVNDPISENASSNSMTSQQPDGNMNSPGNNSLLKPGLSNTTGAGGGSSATANSSQQTIKTAGFGARPENPNGNTAGGGNGLSKNSGQGERSSELVNSTGQLPNTTPLWSATGGAPPQSSAPSTDSEIPPQDRDLVRQYFNR